MDMGRFCSFILGFNDSFISLDIPILNKLNEFFTGRIYLQSNAFKFFGFPLVSFGYMGSKYSLLGR